MEPEPYVTIEQICDYLSVNKQWINDAEKRGFPVRRLPGGRKLRTKISWVERWLDEHQPARPE